MRVMSVIWREGGSTTARHIASVLAEEVGYSPAASYTLTGRCVKKGAVKRVDPGYACHACVTRKEMQDQELDELVETLFDNSPDELLEALLDTGRVSAETVQKITSEYVVKPVLVHSN
jgi:predicted transcriptional regulator